MAPVNVLAPLRVKLAAPDFVKAPVPVMAPPNVDEPEAAEKVSVLVPMLSVPEPERLLRVCAAFIAKTAPAEIETSEEELLLTESCPALTVVVPE
jgi:hypothetical protein